jgi:hypothetical protein
VKSWIFQLDNAIHLEKDMSYYRKRRKTIKEKNQENTQGNISDKMKEKR